MYRQFPPWALAALIVAIALVNASAYHWKLYFHFIWLDKPVHAASGMWIALAALTLYYDIIRVTHRDESELFVIFFALAFATIIGLGWEWFEQFLDHFSGFIGNGVIDTLGDLTADIVGGLLGAWIFIQGKFHRALPS